MLGRAIRSRRSRCYWGAHLRLVANVFDVWTFQRRSEMQAIGVFATEVSSHEVRFEQVATRRLGPDVALVTGVRTAAGWRANHDHSS